jgi:biotin carboxyl carrier protein
MQADLAEHHGDTVPIQVDRTGANVYDVRTPVSGTVVSVVVDEGQMIAEEDPVATVEASAVETVIITEVPGVVRELYIEPGRSVSAGDVIARIDES